MQELTPEEKLNAYRKAYNALFERSLFLYDYFCSIETPWAHKAIRIYLHDIKDIDRKLSEEIKDD